MINTKFYTSRSHSLSPNVKRRMSEQLAKDKRKINILQTPFLLVLHLSHSSHISACAARTPTRLKPPSILSLPILPINKLPN